MVGNKSKAGRFIHGVLGVSATILVVSSWAGYSIAEQVHDPDQCIFNSRLMLRSQPISNPDTASDAIYTATGNKGQATVDLTVGTSDMPLGIERYYDSNSTFNGAMGHGWTWTYGWKLKFLNEPRSQMGIRRADGKLMLFVRNTEGFYHRILERYDETVKPLSGGGWRYTHHNNSTVDFDSDGRAITISSEDGRSYAIDYDSDGNPLTVTNPYGRKLDISVNASGRITTIQSGEGCRLTYDYDDIGNLVAVTFPDGLTHQYLYEDARYPHYLTGNIDENGERRSRYGYDNKGRAILNERFGESHDTVEYVDEETIITTDINGKKKVLKRAVVNGIPDIVEVEDDEGVKQGFAYNDKNLLSCSSIDGEVLHYFYNEQGRLTEEVQGVGTPHERRRSFTYSTTGHVLSATDVMGNTTTFTYDGRGRKLSKTDVAGTTRWIWNEDSSLAGKDFPDGIETSYTYGEFARRISATSLSPDGHAYTEQYDTRGRVVERLMALRDEVLSQTSFVFDDMDRPIRVTDSSAGVMTYDYDETGQLSGMTHIIPGRASKNVTFSYDSEGILVAAVDEQGNPADMDEFMPVADMPEIAFVLAQRLFQDSDESPDVPLPSVAMENAKFDSNGCEDMVLKQPKSNAIYDERKREITSVDDLGRKRIQRFNKDGSIAMMIDFNGTKTKYEYDDKGNLSLSSKTDSQGNNWVTQWRPDGSVASTTGPDGETMNYIYDGSGKQIGIRSASSPAEYAEDGRILSQKLPDGSMQRYFYDKDGRLTLQTTTDADGGVTTTDWNPDGSLKSETTPDGVTVDHGQGRISATYISEAARYKNASANDSPFPNGGVMFSIWDTAGKPILQRHTSAEGKVSTNVWNQDGSQAYKVDEYGRVTYFYDGAIHQMLSTHIDRAGNVTTIEWDSENMSSRRTTNPDGSVFEHGEDGTVKLLPAEEGREHPPIIRKTPDGGQVMYIFDSHGRLTSDKYTDAAGKQERRTWNPNGTLAIREHPDDTKTQYFYDASGVLLRSVYTSKQGKQIVWQWNADGTLASETLPNGKTTVYSDPSKHAAALQAGRR